MRGPHGEKVLQKLAEDPHDEAFEYCVDSECDDDYYHHPEEDDNDDEEESKDEREGEFYD